MIEFNKTIIISAHPDDEVLGLGGTIPIIKENGGEVIVVIVTDGVSSQYPNDKKMFELRDDQLHNACNILGVNDIIRLDFPDMRLDTVSQLDINNSIEKIVRDVQCDTVFVHHQYDVNLDHQILYKSILVVARPKPLKCIRNVLTYQVNSSTEWGARSPQQMFCPNLYVDISSTINKKLEAIKIYSYEIETFPHPRSIEAIKARAKVLGSESGFNYAEAFNLIFSKV